MTTVTSTRHIDAERLSAWISGDLSERDTQVVRSHVESCAACLAGVAELRAQVIAARALDRPDPPPTLWSSIEGALERGREGHDPPWRIWSWPSTLLGALAGAAVVVALTWGVTFARRPPTDGLVTALAPAARRGISQGAAVPQASTSREDPLLVEAERELARAASSYEDAVNRLRRLLEREQVQWDPETRARVGERLAGLDEAVAHSRAVAGRDPGDSTGADLLFSAYQRQIDFLAEVVHRGSPAASGGLR